MVEIIPKPAVKKPPWLNILFYFSLLLLVGIISGYFVLISLTKKSTTTLQNLEQSLVKERAPEEKRLEGKVISWQRKIEKVNPLLNEHYFPSKTFGLLEKLSHPQVWFSELELNLTEARAEISGIAESFPVLGQQLLLFKKEPKILEVNLSEVSIGEEREINFTLNLSLDSQLFK